jgi:predicted nucleic acid-binding protein
MNGGDEMGEMIIYLDAGPVVSLVSNDRFSASVERLLDIKSIRTTSLLSCLEALVVLRRAEFRDYGSVPSPNRVRGIWQNIEADLKDADVDILASPEENPFGPNEAERIIDTMSRGPLKKWERNRSQWIAGVGIIDCIHLMAAESLSATHFMTTDRCLSEVDSRMKMILVPEDNAEKNRAEVRSALMSIGRATRNLVQTAD